MTLPVTDNFTGADGTALHTYNASWIVNSGNFQINTNGVCPNDAVNDGFAAWTGDSFADNHYAEITIAALGADSSASIGPAVRCASGAYTGYILYHHLSGWELWKFVASAGTQLLTGSRTLAVNDVLRLEAWGCIIVVKVNGTQLGYASDVAITSGYAGIHGNGAVTTRRGDGWTADNLSEPSIRSFTGGQSAGNETTSTVTTPTNVNGDKIVIAMVSDSNAQTFAFPGGWNEFFPDEFIIPSNHQAGGAMAEKTAASEGASYAVTLGVSEKQTWEAFSIRATGGLDGTPPASGNGSSATATFPAITTSVNNCLICRVVMADSSAGSILPLGEMTGFYKIAERFNTSGGNIGLYAKLLATAGTEAAGTATLGVAEQWNAWSFAWQPTATGHAPITLSGSIGPSGALLKQPTKLLAGGITPAGALLKKPLKLLAGAITPAGALLKKPLKLLSGAITPSGAITKQPKKVLTGTITPSGTLLKKPSKLLSGSITPTGNLIKSMARSMAGSITPSGVLIKQPNKNLAGSIIPTGSLIKAISKLLSGAIGPVGTLLKQPYKLLSGSISPSGTVIAFRVVLLLVAGALSFTGDLLKQPSKLLSGSITPSGSLAFFRTLVLSIAGSLSFVGDLFKQPTKRLAGSVAPTGTLSLSRVLILLVSGAISFTGNLVKQPQKTMAGVLGPIGTLLKQPSKLLGGSISPSGVLLTFKGLALLFVAGSVGFVGTLSKQPSKLFAGSISPLGQLLKQPHKLLSGAISPSGSLVTLKAIFLYVAGALSFTGDLLKQPKKLLGGSISPSGLLTTIKAGLTMVEDKFKAMYKSMFRKMR